MIQWEYLVQNYSDIGQKTLDFLGSLGWELVSVTGIRKVSNNDTNYTLIFKRPIEKRGSVDT